VLQVEGRFVVDIMLYVSAACLWIGIRAAFLENVWSEPSFLAVIFGVVLSVAINFARYTQLQDVQMTAEKNASVARVNAYHQIIHHVSAPPVTPVTICLTSLHLAVQE
jgi:hypothetical protein